MLSMPVGPVRCDSVSFESEESSFNSGVFFEFPFKGEIPFNSVNSRTSRPEFLRPNPVPGL